MVLDTQVDEMQHMVELQVTEQVTHIEVAERMVELEVEVEVVLDTTQQ